MQSIRLIHSGDRYSNNENTSNYYVTNDVMTLTVMSYGLHHDFSNGGFENLMSFRYGMKVVLPHCPLMT